MNGRVYLGEKKVMKHLLIIRQTTFSKSSLSQKKYKSCHWGCTFSKGTLLYPKAAHWYPSGTY